MDQVPMVGDTHEPHSVKHIVAITHRLSSEVSPAKTPASSVSIGQESKPLLGHHIDVEDQRSDVRRLVHVDGPFELTFASTPYITAHE